MVPVEFVRRLSYVIPYGLVALLAWLGGLSWWAVAMLGGGSGFAWDWLWGDRALLEARTCLGFAATGLAFLAVAFYLADGLNLSLGDFIQLAKEVPRRQKVLYLLPTVGVGLILYGLLGWSRAWLLERDERW
jgi:hypothetical protein